jgi:4'-phosphopantetheinyl transferase
MPFDDPALLSLEQGQVDIWLTALPDIGEALLRRYEELMSEDEHARWRRFRVAHAKLQHLVARALIRTTLSRYFAVPPRSWKFGANRYGRPHVSEPRQFRPLRFNLSHTSGLVACAVAKARAVGIDVENIRRESSLAELAPRVFSPTELAAFLDTPPDMQREVFFSFWTLKEAYIKARGMGLSLPLDGFSFDLAEGFPRVNFTERCPDDSARWQFRQYAPTADHRMAVAVAGVPQPVVRQRWVVPLQPEEERQP